MNDFLLGIALVTAAILLTVPEDVPYSSSKNPAFQSKKDFSEPEDVLKKHEVPAPREEESAAPEAASFL